MGESTVIYGKYRLLEKLAQGGMAEVFKAKAHGVEGFEKILVVKRILSELSADPRFAELFVAEAKVAVGLSHANIVQVFDLGRADDTYFIAMEYVAGLDVARLTERAAATGKPLPAEHAVYIVSEVAKGLDYAHRRRDSHLRPLHIVHRDVCPQNILVSFEGEVKLTDFGIAKAHLAIDATVGPDAFKHKYAYMSPEQLRGEPVDHRSDLFALGTVLYELLAGRSPFLGESDEETKARVLAADPAPLDSVSDVSKELAALVHKALSHEPGDRHPNAGHLYEALVQYLFASERRVGARDLGRLVSAIHEATLAQDEGGARRDSVATELRASFEPEELAAPAQPSSPPESVEVAGTPSTVPRPENEKREITLAALALERPDAVPSSTLHELFRRYGGTVVERRPLNSGHFLWVAFGLSDPDGKDASACARMALRVARLAAAQTSEGDSAHVRVALEVGQVLVDGQGEMVRDERLHALVERTEKLARRALPGQVWASHSAQRTLRTGYQLMAVPGEPGVAALLAERRLDDWAGLFVGRRPELKRVGERLALATRGEFSIIGVSGDPGSGKTRFLWETRRRLRHGGHDVGFFHVRVQRHTQSVPMSAAQDMLRSLLGFDEFDPEPLVRSSVSRLRQLGLSRGEIDAVERALGLGDSGAAPAEAPTRTLGVAIGRIAVKLAEDRLTVFAVDGFDYMDPASREVMAALSDTARGARIALMVAYREGTDAPFADAPEFEPIRLRPLSRDDVEALIAARLDVKSVPDTLLKDVAAKSGGNPLYAEEFLRALVDAGALERVAQPASEEGDGVDDDGLTYTLRYRKQLAALEVPKTLRGMVAARVAKLPPLHRHLLQVAAVVGVSFGVDVLARVTGDAPNEVSRVLRSLERANLLRRSATGEYRFSHDIFTDVLREGLTLSHSEELHSAVADALEHLYPERIEELAERLAEHHREAGHRERAAEYLIRASDRLAQEQALSGASAALMRAIEILMQVPTADRKQILELYERVGRLSFHSRELDLGAERLADAVELARSVENTGAEARLAMLRGRLLVNASRLAQGRKWLARAREVAKETGDRVLLRDVTLAAAEADSRNGEYRSAIELLHEAVELTRRLGDVPGQIRCQIPLALVYAATGVFKASETALGEARRLAASAPDRFTECELLKTEGLILHFEQRYADAIEVAQQGLELAKEYGFWYEAAANAHNIGEAHLRMGEYERAFASLSYSLHLAREHGLRKAAFANERLLGCMDAIRFQREDGVARIRAAVAYAKDNDFLWDVIESTYLLGAAQYAMGEADAARESLKTVERLASDNGNSRYESEASEALAAIDEGAPLRFPPPPRA